MITKPTVFVLGAGASAPYGFPLGNALLDGIRSELERDQSEFRDDLLSAEVNDVMLRDFARALGESGRYSLDEYLQWHPEYRQIGKMAIARMLIPAEQDDRLDFSQEHRPDATPDLRWYRYFFDRLLTSRRGRCDLSQNHVTFITFNFDRSLERSLFRFVRANCAKNHLDAVAQVERIPIYHLHGQLGWPDWLIRGAPPRRGYDPTITNSDTLKMCADQIRIIDDEVFDNPTLQLSLQAVGDAELICFLGFSYHPLNLEKLQIERMKGKEVRGTAYLLPAGPRGSIERTFQAARVDLHLGKSDEHILSFLEQTDLIYD